MALDDKAAAAIAGLLSSSRVLERLVLTHTNITDAGAQLICNSLQVRLHPIIGCGRAGAFSSYTPSLVYVTGCLEHHNMSRYQSVRATLT